MEINLFPTTIWKKQIFPTENQKKETDDLFSDLQEYMHQGVWAYESGKSTGELTKMIHEKHPEMHWITRQSIKHVVEYWKAIKYSTEHDINLETCWVNFHGYGDSTGEHSHVNGIHKADVSAVYYYQKDFNTGHIQFTNPLGHIHEMTPYGTPYRDSEDYRTTVSTQTGDLIIFPSWIKHRTLPNLSTDTRIAVSMNFQLTKYVYVTDGQ
jgi:uncharacterized protein (TIGR02466 family)